MNLYAFFSGLIVIVFLFIFFYFKVFLNPRKLKKIRDQINRGDTRNAIRRLRTIIISKGGSIDAHFLLAEGYKVEGNVQMAVVEYRYCLKAGKKPLLTSEEEIRDGLVECYLKLNKVDEALTELLLLSNIDPKNYRYLFQIAKIFFRKGSLEQAVIYLDRTIKVNPTHAESLSYLGMIMYHTNQIREAVLYLTKAIKCNPKNYKAYYYLGRVYRDGRDLPMAITYFTASQRSSEYKIRAFLQKGNCYREMREIENAIDEYKKGMASATSKDQNVLLATKYVLADLYESRGKLTEAIEQWEGIYKIDPNYRDILKKLNQYQDLRADDNMKDFLVSPLPVFEGICLDIVNWLGYDLVDMKNVKTSITNITATPKPSIARNIKRQLVYIKIYRDVISLGLNTVKNLLDEAKNLRCVKAICVSPAKFRPEAVEFSSARQIDLIGGDELSKILNEIKD